MKNVVVLFLFLCQIFGVNAALKVAIPMNKVQDPQLLNLIDEASKAYEKAYIPKGRNNYRVGAAVLTEDGQIYRGSNVKIPCGLDICAERVALYVALQQAPHPLKIKAIAIDTPQKKAVSPCGVCREALNYFVDENTLMIFRDSEGEMISTPFHHLLPLPFKSEKK